MERGLTEKDEAAAVGLLEEPTEASFGILVFARRTYWEVREWRWRRLPPDERFGFANPLEVHGGEDTVLGVDSLATSTGASQPQG